jgi:signal transduction histidine kinase
MNKRIEAITTIVEHTLPSLIVAILLIYTYAKFFQHPYLGFRTDSRGSVILIFAYEGAENALQIGDRILQVDSEYWEDYQSDLRRMIFTRTSRGEVVSLLVERDGQQFIIPWISTGPTFNEIIDLVVSEGWLAFFFWIAGTLTLLNLRPKDIRWRLMIAFNYLTSIWLVVGSGVSIYHIWGSAILLRMAVWLCVPVYLHLHWVFPRTLGKLPGAVLWLVYLGAGALAIAEWFQALPLGLYFSGFLLAMAGSLILLFVHAVLQPGTRRDLRLLLVVALVAFIPSIALGIIGGILGDAFGSLPAWIGGGAILSLPLLPLAYFYAAYRRQLGNAELRINRLISIYLFLTLLAAVLLPPVILTAARFYSPGATMILAMTSSIFAALMVLWGYPFFQRFLERRIYGIPLPSKPLLETYSTQITTSISLPDLIQVLHEEVLPTLLIRQFAFLQLDQGSLKLLSTMGLKEQQVPKEQDVPYLMNQAGVYRSPDLASRDRPFPWVRLILPLKLGDQLLGFWLFGRRDPDDFYSQLEIPVLGSLANLTAIALSNVLQTEHLKAMYEANIDRYEQERLRLARDLHDSILNEMAALLMRGDAPVFSPAFQQAFEVLTEKLREIVNNLRPPMLAYGLNLALEDFAENLMERSQDSVEFVADVQADGEWRYPEVVENNLYRIVQEACENALRYAQAKRITIFGRLRQQELDIRIEDDGIGFSSEISLKLDEMLANKHFGLAGMYERADLIGADISIHSQPNQGTKIQLTWKSKESI